jgi:glycerol-1-phosphate dehydrogenase [NAD(P)+]
VIDDVSALVQAVTGAGPSRQIDLPRFLRAVEGTDALEAELARVLKSLGADSPLFISGSSQSAAVCNDLAGTRGTRTIVADNSRAEVKRIAAMLQKEHDVVIGIGGGRPIDVAKASGLQADVPTIVIPTQLSADGIASPIAVIREHNDTVVSERSALPIAVIADLETLACAPVSFARAGIGDLISNRTALNDWRIAAEDTEEEVDDFAALLASCAQLLIEGMDLSPLGRGEMNVDLARRLLDGLVLSGLAMEIAGSSRPCSGSEHLISHALDALEPGTAAHGEQVAFGTIVATALQGGDVEAVRSRVADVGMSGAVSGFGLATDRLAEVIQYGPSTRVGRYTVFDRLRPSSKDLRALIDSLRA